MSSERLICIHGHFYQPPRENPWLESIEVQDSAHPFHDWNERITMECYASNGASRILDAQNRVLEIVNNYSRISFNFGPTLLSWLEAHRPDVYAGILRADQLGMARYSGHGPALAQVYNHLIMPLATARDRRTQIVWGLRDFEHRFGRAAEGMWLAETAVDTQTLELLAEYGVAFTVLAPNQAARVRALGDDTWHDVSRSGVDPRRAYIQKLPSGRSIALYFYDGPISRAVAFEKLLERGERFAWRLTSSFEMGRDEAQLVHIATDGETYGHHHRHGEMALSYAIQHIETHKLARMTIYGEHLAEHPPQWEAQIVEDSSWSCAHGVERWRSDCGCHTGGSQHSNQAWRGPLRCALDFLRDAITARFEEVGGELFRDPWEARDAYIDVILARTPARVDRFLASHARRELTAAEQTCALELMELQRHAQLMYTSCGWFFHDLAGIETTQILSYAARVIQLAQNALHLDLEPRFLQLLAMAWSNDKKEGNGKDIFLKHIRPSMVTLRQVCAHHTIDSLFEPVADVSRCYAYEVDLSQREFYDAGQARMALGVARVTSMLTRRTARFEFGALHLGDHNVDAGVRRLEDGDRWDEAARLEAVEAFERGELPRLIRMLDRQFGDEVFTLRSLFRDEQRRVLQRVMKRALTSATQTYRQVYERRAPLIAFLHDLGAPLPLPFEASASVALQAELDELLERSGEVPRSEVIALMKEARNMGVELNWEMAHLTLHTRLSQAAADWRARPESIEALEGVVQLVELIVQQPIKLSMWEAQNAYLAILGERWSLAHLRALGGSEEDETWCKRFEELAAPLNISPSVFSN